MEKVVHKYKLGEEPDDLTFWLQKTPLERLSALNILRERYISFFLNGHNPGFQRVYKLIKRS